MNRINTSNRIFILPTYITMFLIIFLSGVTRSYALPSVDGTCAPEPTKLLYIDIRELNFTENKQGEREVLNTHYSEYVTTYCYSKTTTLNLDYFYGEINNLFPKSTVNSGAFKLNDDVDFIAHVFIQPYVYDAMENKEYKFSTPLKITGSSTPYLIYQLRFNDFIAVEIILRRPLLGGALIIPEGTILGQFYLYAYSGQKGTVPFGQIVTGGVISAPIICNINSGNMIDVDFNIIDSSQLTTTSASSTLSLDKQLDYSCNNSLSQNISVKLVATASNFDGNAIKTSNKDIGIIMLQNGKPVPPGGAGFSTTLKDGKGSDTVTFVPVKSSSAKIATGAFSASATLIITAA